MGFVPGFQGWSNICTSVNVIYHINERKDKNHMIIDAEKAFDKIQHPFMIKTLKVGIKGIYPNTVKAIYDKPTANIILNEKKLKAFPLKSGTREECPLLPILFNIVLEVLTTAIRQETKEERKKGRRKEGRKEEKRKKERKKERHPIGREDVKPLLFADDTALYKENPKVSTKKTIRTNK